MQNNNLPDWWKIVKLKDYTTERKQKNKANEELTVFSISNKRWFVKSDDYFEWQVYSKDLKNYKIVKKWDFAYNPARINVWSIAYLESKEIWLLSPMYVIFSLNKEIDKDYFSYFIKWNLFNKQVNNFTQWAVRQILAFWDLWNISLLLPPLEVQKEIAWKLNDLDKLIQTQNNQIEKYEKLKKAMMKKLFSEWIWHTEFKEDKYLGKIPKEWEVKKLWDLIYDLKSWLSRELSNEDLWLPVIRSNNLENNKITFKDIKFWYLDDPKWSNTSNYYLKKWDILINFINSEAQIGKTAYYDGNYQRNIIFTTNILKFRLYPEIMNDLFFINFTQTNKYKKYIELITKPAVNQASFTNTDLKKMKIPIPTLEEQKKIADILGNIDNLLEKEREIKEGYEKVKKWIVSLVFSCNLLIK